MRQNRTNLKGEAYKSILIIGDFTTPIPEIDGTRHRKSVLTWKI